MSLFTKLGTWIFDNQRDQRNQVTPFQSLRFLVRDWPYPDEYHYGGGDQGQYYIPRRHMMLLFPRGGMGFTYIRAGVGVFLPLTHKCQQTVQRGRHKETLDGGFVDH